MPDWFYRTIARPVLHRLPDEVARALALGTIGTLGRSAPGRAIIEFLGHMESHPKLACRVAGTEFPSRIGLGWRVDPELRATRALECFGVGCVEILVDRRRRVSRADHEHLRDRTHEDSAASEVRAASRPLLRRRIAADGTETVTLPSGHTLPVVALADEPQSEADGVMLQVGARADGACWHVPTTMPVELISRVREWRQRLPAGAALLVSGGAANPSDAQAILAAGADLVLIDAGLVFRGPGLVKRCNEALLAALAPDAAAATDSPEPRARRAWLWVCALGIALLAGGVATLALALTRVLLPYDEHYLGLTADALRRNAPRLFAFMAHDRGTLAGTMLGLGSLYLMLGWHAVRREVHGARTAVVASALTRFVSFFAFFGFGYFDTLHAFVAAILFQLTVQVMVGRTGGAAEYPVFRDDEDAAWRSAQWGQFLWVLHAAGLLIAGAVILWIGMTSVFVAEDLGFLCASREEMQSFGPRMTGVIAHDRATLGGMLLAAGTGMLLPVLWCHRRGARWLWWTMFGLGLPAYAAALGVHAWVGYTAPWHIAPALIGLALWLGGLVVGRNYLLARQERPARV